MKFRSHIAYLIIAAFFVAVIALGGCTSGTFEEAGEEVDETLAEVEEETEDAADEVEEEAEELEETVEG
jgi:gas vesicle protein